TFEIQAIQHNSAQPPTIKITSSGIIIHDVPLGITIADINNAASTIGKVKSISLREKARWQTAHVNFEETDKQLDIQNIWAITIKKDSCRVYPKNNFLEIKEYRNQFISKLTNLSPGCTAYELKQLLDKIKAKTCFIPHTRNKYN
ncbi:13156_t:CDS:1, partial [Racocetra fulgida]